MRRTHTHISIHDSKGAAMLVAVILFLLATTIILVGIISPILKQASISKNIFSSTNSYYLASGGVEDVYYRLISNKQISSVENLTLNGNTTTIITSDTPTGKSVVSVATSSVNVRKVKADFLLGTGISFHYGVQSGQGGFYLQNSSSVTGNIHSAGAISGTGNNMVRGDVVSSGASGLITGVHATGTAFAHNITNSTIDKDAYYTNITNTTVNGVSHPGSPDQPQVALPISDAQIAIWESDAAAGGTVSCTGGKYTISSSVTIGPKKIPCDLLIKGSGITITVTGPIWAVGNIDTQVSPLIKMDPSLGSSNVAIIADNAASPTTSGLITIGQNTSFQGSGSVGSFVFMISQNTSAENGGSTNAISMGQGASALVAYAAHGLVTLQQSVGIKEVTAYKIILQNTANVTYDRGLPSVLFESGPAGGYDILEWKEI